MRNTGCISFVFVFILITMGCGTAATSRAPDSGSSTTVTSNKTAVASELVDDITDTKPSSNAAANTAQQSSRRPLADKTTLEQGRTSTIDTSPTDRKIIRNADLSLETESPEDIQRRITSIAESNGGFVVESQQTSTDQKAIKRDTVTMSVRVPAQKFGSALEEIRQASDKVIYENIKGDDVTEEFIDVEARLKAQKALELQFVEIMKRAGSVNDALNVQRELADVRGEIEKIEGRKRFLENQSSLSTIKVKLQTPAAAFTASSTGFSTRLGQSFNAGLEVATSFVLGLLTLAIAVLPLGVFVGVPLFFLVKYLRKHARRQRSVNEIAKDELSIS